MDLNLREIRQFIRFLADTDVGEVEIKEEGRTLRIVRQSAQQALQASQGQGMVQQSMMMARTDSLPMPMVALPPPSSSGGAAPAPEPRETTVAITAPMVGTFYKAASPESAPFVRLGDVVKKGQVVCIIEAMKLMNEIESEVSGRVVSIVKENATPVEYGEEMFLVEPG